MGRIACVHRLPSRTCISISIYMLTPEVGCNVEIQPTLCRFSSRFLERQTFSSWIGVGGSTGVRLRYKGDRHKDS
jgi:hypothetical protein